MDNALRKFSRLTAQSAASLITPGKPSGAMYFAGCNPPMPGRNPGFNIARPPPPIEGPHPLLLNQSQKFFEVTISTCSLHSNESDVASVSHSMSNPQCSLYDYQHFDAISHKHCLPPICPPKSQTAERLESLACLWVLQLFVGVWRPNCHRQHDTGNEASLTSCHWCLETVLIRH